MPKILPIRDLKNTSQISQICKESNEPIFITKNGYGDMVLLSIELYEEILQRLTDLPTPPSAKHSQKQNEEAFFEKIKNMYIK